MEGLQINSCSLAVYFPIWVGDEMFLLFVQALGNKNYLGDAQYTSSRL